MTIDLIEHNPMLKKPLLAVLAASEQHPNEDRRAIEEHAAETWDDAFTQSPAVSVDILVRNGALTERVFVDGMPYDGTLEDLQLDEQVAEDAVAESRVAITEAGRALLDAYAPETTLSALIADKPHYRDVYVAILNRCAVVGGCSRTDLEQAIGVLPHLQPDPATQRTRVYPQYFIDALESAGGIVWDGAWRITSTGKALIAA